MSGDESGGPPATKQPRVETTGSKGKAPSAPAAEQLRAMIKEAVAIVWKEQGAADIEGERGRGASGSGEIFEYCLVINSFRASWHTPRGAVSGRPEGAHFGGGWTAEAVISWGAMARSGEGE